MTKKLEQKLKDLPMMPGIYVFKDARGKILYVGKAARLRPRVRQYWQARAPFYNPAKYKMLKEIADIEIKTAGSEIEALLLEANYIKKYRPPYNVLMKDNKSYAYIRISTEEDYPRVMVTRRITRAGRYFGPFTNSRAAKETLRTLRKFLPYRCDQKPNGRRPCLYFHLGRCPGVCVGRISKTDYRRLVRQIILFLEGKKDTLVKRLVKASKEAKKKGDDALARLLAWQVENMRDVLAHTQLVTTAEKFAFDAQELARILGLPVLPRRVEGYDISNIHGKQATGSMVVFEEGEPNKDEYRRFKIKLTKSEPNDVAMLKEVLTRRFRQREAKEKFWPRPDLIIIDGGKGQLNAAVSVIKKYKLATPVISIAKKNEEIYFPGESKPLILPRTSPALHLVERVRDEAHRFALSYHRLLRSKRFLR